MMPISPLQRISLLVLTILTSLLFISTHAHSQVYKSVDKNGNPIFSDTPGPNADEIIIRQPNTAKPTEIPSRLNPEQEQEDATNYHVSITDPLNNSVIANGLLPFKVAAKVTPALEEGHQLQLRIDGSIHGSGLGSFTVNGVARGQHTFVMAVVDSENKVLATSATVSIYAYRPN